MIDFRYHLISLVAVFLALGLGILMGSVVLDQTLVNDLKSRLEDISKSNDRLHDEITELDSQNSAARDFADEIQAWVVPGRLAEASVVLIEIDGTAGATLDRARSSLQSAGAEVASTVTLSDSLSLESRIDRDRLALALNSTSSTAAELRSELGAALGARAADVANSDGAEGRAAVTSRQRLSLLVDALETNDFIAVDARDPQEIVPSDALFLIVGGNREHQAFEGSRLTADLGIALAQRGVPVLLAEPSDSAWGLVFGVRNDTEARNLVSTVDDAETIAGGISVVLGLEDERRGETGHYGYGPASTTVVPQPSPAG